MLLNLDRWKLDEHMLVFSSAICRRVELLDTSLNSLLLLNMWRVEASEVVRYQMKNIEER